MGVGGKFPWVYFAFQEGGKFFKPFSAGFSHSSLLQLDFLAEKSTLGGILHPVGDGVG